MSQAQPRHPDLGTGLLNVLVHLLIFCKMFLLNKKYQHIITPSLDPHTPHGLYLKVAHVLQFDAGVLRIPKKALLGVLI